MDSQATERVDVAVIGAGTAGLAAFRAARRATERVLLIEGGHHGTTCARVGCMPSKLLIAAADAAHHARDAGPFGVHAEVRVDGREVMERVRRERDRFVGFVLDSVNGIPKEHHASGYARFAAPVDGEGAELQVGERHIKARAVVVATGSSPVVPAMFDAVKDRVVVNDDVFSWDTLPASVAVFGAGIIGLELGQALHRLGVRVRIFGKGGTVGPLSDPEVKAAARAALEEELAIDFAADVRGVAPGKDGGVDVTFADASGVRTESFATALVAAGRRPNLGSLGLERAGIDAKAKVDPHTLRWGELPVFLPGDANGEVPLLHEAADEGAIAGENAAKYPVAAPGPRRSRLGIAFCDPQIAVVGSSWAELTASARKTPFVTGAVGFADQGRSRVMRMNRGALRVYAEPGTGRFLGAEMAGPRAEHLGHLLAWSHQAGLTIDGMLAMPFYHPVVEEGLRTALRDASANLKKIH